MCVQHILIDPYFAVGKLRILSEKKRIRRMVETSEKHFRFFVGEISSLSLSLCRLFIRLAHLVFSILKRLVVGEKE